MVAAAAVEAMAGAWVDRAAFVATLRRCARSLEGFGSTEWLLEMLAGSGQDGWRARLLQLCRMLNGCLSGWEGCWRVCEGCWIG